MSRSPEGDRGSRKPPRRKNIDLVVSTGDDGLLQGAFVAEHRSQSRLQWNPKVMVDIGGPHITVHQQDRLT